MQVFKFGAKRPSREDDLLIRDICRRAERYYNELIAIHRHEVERTLIAKPRVRKGSGLDQSGISDPDWSKLLHRVALDKINQARSDSGLSCGTYWLVEESVQRARSDSFPDLPRFRRSRERPWELVGACLTTNNQEKPLVGVWDQNIRIEKTQLSKGGRHQFAEAHVRVVAKRGESRTVTIPIVLHRPLPEGARIQRVAIQVQRVGTRNDYALIVTVNTSSETATGVGRVSVNLGWRRVEGGVRVATAVGTDGVIQHLVLPDRIVGRALKAEELRSLGDGWAVQRFGDARRRTSERQRVVLTPEGRELGKVRFVDAKSVSPEHWARRDRHVYQWERDSYRSMMLARQHLFRVWARQLSRQYAECTVDDWDMAQTALRISGYDIPEARHYRFLVAPSYLRNDLERTFGALQKVAGSCTITCHACGNVSANAVRNKAKHLVIKCEHCSAVWDQDVNNARNQQVATAAE